MRTVVSNLPTADHVKLAVDTVGARSLNGRALVTPTAELLDYLLHELFDRSCPAHRLGSFRPSQSTYEAQRPCRQIGGAS